MGVRQAPCGVPGFLPTDATYRLYRPVRVQVCHGHDLQTIDTTGLSQDHGSEFAGADHADAHRPAVFQPPIEEMR